MNTSDYCTFYIIRHGITEWNIKGIIQGHRDAPLINEGKLQAKQWAEEFKHIKFDAVFSSDSLRARQTAEIIAIEKKLAVKTTELLREKSFGQYEGKPLSIFTNELKELVERFAKLSDGEKKKHSYPTMESDEEIVCRFITFLREAAVAYPGKTVLVVSHSGTISVLLIHLGYSSYKSNPTYLVKHNAYVKLLSNGIEFIVKETKGIKDDLQLNR